MPARLARRTTLIALLLVLSGCATMPSAAVPVVPFVDLPRFMGDWYVIANIPTFLDKASFAATESYQLNTDGTVATTFSQRKGSFSAPLKSYHPTGFVRPTGSNAEWGMRFIWPFKAEYLIAYVDESYSQAIIARNKRDYVWILARSAQISESDYQALSQRVAALGYDTALLRRIPQVAAHD